ncbi:hypothetical protein HaLaN_27527 [Haematococcus lacustris]|uniref:Uncharacterized protein n=1 Tax=Haematococcus lacustris TaxID=44745 RepID=A0A6A0A926_HAELA|nr:hypothetical protein HaLaN_27527 [Haematococcus lacustris]
MAAKYSTWLSPYRHRCFYCCQPAKLGSVSPAAALAAASAKTGQLPLGCLRATKGKGLVTSALTAAYSSNSMWPLICSIIRSRISCRHEVLGRWRLHDAKGDSFLHNPAEQSMGWRRELLGRAC